MQSDMQIQVSQFQAAQSRVTQSPVPQSLAPQSRTSQPKTTKAAVYQENGIITLEDRPVLRPKDPQDVIIKVTPTTICSSDIHTEHGAVPKATPGTILEHEFAGIVGQTGEAVRRFKPGDRVAMNVETFCGECYFCKRGYVNNCTHGHRGWALGHKIDGGQAGHVRAPFADNGLTRIPGEVTDEVVLFIGDILSIGYWGVPLAEIKPADTVAVIGAGPIGLCTPICARLYGPGTAITTDTSNERLGSVKEQGLADVILDPFEQDVEQEIRDLTPGRGADAVLEVAGGRDTFQMTWKTAKPNAVVRVVILYGEPQMLPFPDTYGKNLVFKIGGVSASCYEKIMELIRTGKLGISCLTTHRAKLENITGAYDVFENKRNYVTKYAIEVS